MEPSIRIPLWLELSGLPEAMNQAARSPAAWLLFCKLVAEDCRLHPETPGILSFSMRQLGKACGIEPSKIPRILQSLQKHRWIGCFIPDNEEEEGLFQIKIPLPAPLGPDAVRRAHPELFTNPLEALRYEKTGAGGEQAPDEPENDPVLQDVVDLYFNSISMKMNNFILDELRLIRKQFPYPLIRRIFKRAKEHGVTSLHWAMKQLHREALAEEAAKRKNTPEATADAIPEEGRNDAIPFP